MYRLEERGRRGRVITVPVGKGCLLEGLGERRDGRSSFEAIPVRVGDGTGVGVGWVRDTGANKAILFSVVLESPGVVFDGVASSVNHMGWYCLRTRVARMRYRVYRCVWAKCMNHGDREEHASFQGRMVI